MKMIRLNMRSVEKELNEEYTELRNVTVMIL